MKRLLILAMTLAPTLSSAQVITSAKAEKELSKLDFFNEGQGMHLSPGILGHLEKLRALVSGTRLDESVLQTLTHRWGIQSNQKKLIGLKTVRYQGMKVGVVGCVACHSGKAAGQYIIGIGNKNIDPGQMGIDGVLIESAFKKMTDGLNFFGLEKKSEEYKRVENSSIALMHTLRNPKLSATTQGLVPISLVGSWFYQMQGNPIPDHGFKGAVKVPAWFGFKKKLEVGQFADAIGQGHPPGWIIGVEITAGQSPDAVRRYFKQVEHASELIGALTPPRYPFPIQVQRANRGREIFEASCAHCHGTYEWDEKGLPIYQVPKAVPLEKVGTDSDRLDYVTEDFLDQVRASPLSDLIKLSPLAGKRMYIAPRLHAIWSRFPYLHNASVPTLRDLLEPAKLRPNRFSLDQAGEKERFDPSRVGLTLLKLKSSDQERSIYDTSQPGQSNQGHEKSTDLSESEKGDLIEYLKTL